jgi:hypothetical protein
MLRHFAKIDETVLLRLTAEDLKDIGVGAIGHRRKLLDAIAALRTKCQGRDARRGCFHTKRRAPPSNPHVL